MNSKKPVRRLHSPSWSVQAWTSPGLQYQFQPLPFRTQHQPLYLSASDNIWELRAIAYCWKSSTEGCYNELNARTLTAVTYSWSNTCKAEKWRIRWAEFCWHFKMNEKRNLCKPSGRGEGLLSYTALTAGEVRGARITWLLIVLCSLSAIRMQRSNSQINSRPRTGYYVV